MYIVKENDLAVATGSEGRYDIALWSSFLRELDDLDCPSVVDVRQIEAEVSEIDAYLLALQTADLRCLRAHRLALVTSGDPNCYAAFFAVCGRNRGLDIAVFETLDNATDWARGLA